MNVKKINLQEMGGLALDDYSAFWIVVSGVVEVFSKKKGKGAGLEHKDYLYSAEKGSILFGFDDQDANTEFALVVEGDATILRLDKSDIDRLERKSLQSKMDLWLEQWASTLSNRQPPRLYTNVHHFNDLSIRKQEVMFSSEGVRWVELLDGSISVLGGNIEVEHSEERPVLMPCTKHFWISGKSRRSKLKFYPTSYVIEDSIQLLLTIKWMLIQLDAMLLEAYDRRMIADAERINLRNRLDDNRYQLGLRGIHDIVGQKSSVSGVKSFENDSLLLACQTIGHLDGYKDIKSSTQIEADVTKITSRLDDISRASNLRYRKVILRGVWWKDNNGHLLAFKKDSKDPIVLECRLAKGYIAHDVVAKTEFKVTEETLSQLEPVAYMFLFPFKKQISSIRDLLNFGVRGLRGDIVYMFAAAFIGSLLALTTPVLSRVLFDDVIPNADRSFLVEIGILMGVVAIVTTLLQLVRSVFILRLESRSNVNVQAGLMDHLLKLPVSFFGKYSAGDLTQRVLGINSIRSILSNTLITAILSGTFSIVNLVLIFYYNAKMALIAVVLVVIAIIAIGILAYAKLRYDRQISHHDGALQGFMFQLLSGISKIRITGSEKRFFALWAEKFSKIKSLSFHSGNYQNFVETINSVFPWISYMIFFGIIYQLSSDDSNVSIISVGVFMAFLSAFNQFLNDCLSMCQSLVGSLNIVPLYERIKPILTTVPESHTETVDPGELSGEIEFNSINFRYNEDQPLVLKDVSFKINPGEMVAFVGPSGSGKSTILRLLLGFEEPENGAVYYDGLDFTSLNKNLLRRQIGVVLQNGALMAGSIYKNIAGNSDISLQEAEKAAHMSGLEDDLKQMPMGMHTVISEGASTFSGGQKQRLMIARAIVHKPRLIFMDEATSALDNRTQKLVSDSLNKLQATRIVIAHRLSTIRNADRIFVLDQGQIVESGSYDELIKLNGVFASMANRQLINKSH